MFSIFNKKNSDGKKKDSKKDKSKKDEGKKVTAAPSVIDVSTVNEEAEPLPITNHDDFVNGSESARFEDLRNRLEASELECQRVSDNLEQMTAQKMALERDVATLQKQNVGLRASNETLVAEKWELSAANADLQNRLQTMAITYMQGRPDDNMLQEELRRMQMSLADERKVTEKLSRNLELEKRRSESLEQKVKGTHRRSVGGTGGSSNSGPNGGGSGGANGNSAHSSSTTNGVNESDLPEEIRGRDEQVMTSMEQYRTQCENMTLALEECSQKLIGFEIQEDYHVADLRKELCNVKKLLGDEQRRCKESGQRISETQFMFGQMLKDYNSAVDQLNQLQQDKRIKCSQIQRESSGAEMGGIPETVKSFTTTAQEAEKSKNDLFISELKEDLAAEQMKVVALMDKIKRLEADLDDIPLIRAQAEVYKTDFDAERKAREEIAGEKADLMEEIRRLKQLQNHRPENEYVPAATSPARGRRNPVTATTVRDAVNNFAAEHDRQREDADEFRGTARRDRDRTFSCPKCSKVFPILALLQNHVNDCLDRP